MVRSPTRIPYDGVRALFPEQRPSSPELGRALADTLVQRLEQGLATGAAMDAPAAAAGPSWATLAFFVVVSAVGCGVVLRLRRRKGADA